MEEAFKIEAEELSVLVTHVGSNDMGDKFIWFRNVQENYQICEGYIEYNKMLNHFVPCSELLKAFDCLWLCKVLLKNLCFSVGGV